MKRVALLALTAILSAQTPVDFDRIRNAAAEQQNWLTYWGDYAGQRYRDVKQINAGNVKHLRADWLFQTGVTGAFQAVPLVVDGVMFVTGGDGTAFALDAKTGRQLWRYRYSGHVGKLNAQGTMNRGFAMLGQKLFMTTPNAHLVALDARTGRMLWDTEMGPSESGYAATMAPLAIKGKIVAGISGGEYGIRGFVDAYDPETGKRIWRFYTIPAKGEPGGDTWLEESWRRGGGPTWMTGTFDAELNTLYWGVGNPGPDLYGKVRQGDNLYSCSLLALDPDTGKLKWHYQFTPHDTHDWDANETPMLLDLPWQGKMRKLVVQANRNSFYYVLDRVTGEFLMAKQFARQTWNDGFDEKGRPIVKPGVEPTTEGVRVCPGLAGGTNWMAPSYHPGTGWFYFAVREQCDVFYATPPVYVDGKPYWGSVFRGWNEEPTWGAIRAIDPLTAETKWEFRLHQPPWAGTLATAGGLIFAGDEDGYLLALDAQTGALLWKIYTGSRIVNSPITYMVDGKQYVTIPSGGVVLTFALPPDALPGAATR